MEQTKRPARFVLAWILVFLTLTLNSACTSSDSATDATNQVTQKEEIDTTNGGAGSTGGSQSVPDGYYTEQIKTIAANSACATYSWPGRSKAPTGYIKGMALTYARFHVYDEKNGS